MRRPRRPPPVNLKLEPFDAYAAVQRSVTDPIRRSLPRSAWRTTAGDARSGALNLTLFIRSTADVLLSHGLADKRYLWISDDEGKRLVNGFAHVLLPGPWLRRELLASRTVHLEPEQLHIVGWPRLDTLLAAQRRQRSRQPSRGRRRTRVLWAPTHDARKRGPEERSTSTYPEFERYLPALAERFDVEVSLHPINRRGNRPTGSQLAWADVVVSDFGTMVYEAWAMGLPVVFPRWILAGRVEQYLPRAAEGHIHREGIGLHADSIEELLAMVAEADRPGPDVEAFMADYLAPETLGRAGEVAAGVLDRIRRGGAGGPPPTVTQRRGGRR